MIDIEKNISTFVESQFPDFYKEDGPLFILFVKEYYKWLEENYVFLTLVDDTNFNIGDVLIKEKLAKIHVSHDQGYQHLYYSRAFNDEKMEFLRAYLSENGIRYLILINKFEVIKSLFFPKNNILSLHLEVYNSRLEKIAGSKNNYRMIVRKRMYYNVFEYSVKKTIDELYAELFKFLQDQ